MPYIENFAIPLNRTHLCRIDEPTHRIVACVFQDEVHSRNCTLPASIFNTWLARYHKGDRLGVGDIYATHAAATGGKLIIHNVSYRRKTC
jgi:hypothetical protein